MRNPVLKMATAKPDLCSMIRINVDQVLQQAEEEKKQPKPLPKIRIGGNGISLTHAVVDEARNIKPEVIIKADISHAVQGVKSSLVQTLWVEFNALKIERNKLSTQIAHMVEAGATQEELRDQYNRIESFRPQLQDLYDKIAYAEKHGELPTIQDATQDPETLADLKLKKESIIDLRSKLKTKLAKKVAKNPAKYVEWELELAKANIEFQDIIDRIKVMEGKR